MIHISFYIKPRNQRPLFLYDIRTIPVPYHMNEELIDESESKYTYTKVKPTTRILAMGSNTQINLDYDQLVHCVKYNILFLCEQMFLEKQGNEHTGESAIYTNQNEKLIQQKCTIEYYPKLDPDPDILDAGNYILLGNFPLPWTYFCEQKDEIPSPISGSSYVIIKKHDLCQCSLSAGSWDLEANIAYCTENPDNPSSQLTLYYTVNMATVIYQFQEKLKTEGITDLTLFTEQILFDAKEPDLNDIVMKRTYQSFKMDPKLLEEWNSSMLEIRRSPWINMRLILNKIASDNISDLFPSDWAPKPCFSELQEKHFKILSEVMSTIFYQCGILQEYDVMAIHGYEQFLKGLHHHMVMGNVTINQLGHFLILMTYMSFFRLNYYTNYMRQEDAVNLEVAVWMSIVIMAFRTSFHVEGSHRTINPYFKVLNTII